MKLSEIESKIQSMVESEYFKEDEIKFLTNHIMKFNKDLSDYFGNNDGEALDTDAIEFVIQLTKLRMLQMLGEYEEE